MFLRNDNVYSRQNETVVDMVELTLLIQISGVAIHKGGPPEFSVVMGIINITLLHMRICKQKVNNSRITQKVDYRKGGKVVNCVMVRVLLHLKIGNMDNLPCSKHFLDTGKKQ